MEPLKTTGIVVRTHESAEANMMMTVISPELGRISVYARGIKSRRHKSRSSASPLCYSEFILKPRGNIYSLTEATLIESFYGIRTSLEKLSLAMYMASLAETLSAEGMEAAGLIKLLLNSLYYLEKDLKQFEDLRYMFEIRALDNAGFMPGFDRCGECGAEDVSFFDIRSGAALCKRCAALYAMPLSRECVSLTRYYIGAPLKKALSCSAPKNIAGEGIHMLERFISEHIGHIKAKDYLNNIINMKDTE